MSVFAQYYVRKVLCSNAGPKIWDWRPSRNQRKWKNGQKFLVQEVWHFSCWNVEKSIITSMHSSQHFFRLFRKIKSNTQQVQPRVKKKRRNHAKKRTKNHRDLSGRNPLSSNGKPCGVKKAAGFPSYKTSTHIK